jgi:uncharacterized protein YecE (DUF72 family)
VVRFGLAGWDYKDWRGRVYPLLVSRDFDPLGYLARYFDTIEVNSTFYGPGSPRSSASWARRVEANPRFRFTAKLWRRFTHERETAWTPDEVALMRSSLVPLAEAGRLGCVLAQFPWSFKRRPENEEWLGDVLRAFGEFPVAVEVRHSSWNVPEFYAWLTERRAAVVNLDQPLFGRSIKPGSEVTAPVGYVRLHGRNYANWFREDAESHERYDYLYSASELTGWLDRIHEIAQRARDTYVIANNHYQGQAVVNAAMLRRLYGDTDVHVPPQLSETYRGVLEPLGIASGNGPAQ